MINNIVNKDYLRMITIDGSKTCTLECPKCRRQSYRKEGLPPGGPDGKDLSLDNFKKLLNYFDHFSFCGQVSDPIFTPNLIDMLKLINDAGKSVNVATAATSKKHNKDWYFEAFKANPQAKWIFGIDGLPHMSFMYRINQDGEKIFKMMLESRKYLNEKRTIWQYLVFNYNQYDLNECRDIAEKNNIVFNVLESNRIKEFDYDDPNNEIGTVMKNIKFIKNQYGKIKDWQYINEK